MSLGQLRSGAGLGGFVLDWFGLVLGRRFVLLFVDHDESDRAARYYAETDFPGIPDDLLGQCLREFSFRPDFVLLDSAGHMGYVEFRYLLPFIQAPCYLALDDIYHVKHYRSFSQLCQDSRFELIAASEEKFGFCVAKFTPSAIKE